MPSPRLSAPPTSKGKPVILVVVFLLIAGLAGGLTYALYPSDPPPPPPDPTPPPRPMQSLIDIPVAEPLPQNEPDASAEIVDADVDQAPPTKAHRTKRRRMPEGTIDRRRLSAFIRTKNGQVRQCYERRLKQNNTLQGTLVPTIRIHPSGSVMSVDFTQDTLHDSVVSNCVARLIRSWRFPQPEGGAVTVSNPYRFAPRHD